MICLVYYLKTLSMLWIVAWLPESLVIPETISAFIMPLLINNVNYDNLFNIDFDMLVYYLNTQVDVIKL